jgi:hypothetical protein
MSEDFKASPAQFEYFIALAGDKICKLRVEFQAVHCITLWGCDETPAGSVS